jgi:hypothetical protein
MHWTSPVPKSKKIRQKREIAPGFVLRSFKRKGNAGLNTRSFLHTQEPLTIRRHFPSPNGRIQKNPSKFQIGCRFRRNCCMGSRHGREEKKERGASQLSEKNKARVLDRRLPASMVVKFNNPY